MLDLQGPKERLKLHETFLVNEDGEDTPSALDRVTVSDYRALIAEVERLRDHLKDMEQDRNQHWKESEKAWLEKSRAEKERDRALIALGRKTLDEAQ